jgi:hypothetical protein
VVHIGQQAAAAGPNQAMSGAESQQQQAQGVLAESSFCIASNGCSGVWGVATVYVVGSMLWHI